MYADEKRLGEAQVVVDAVGQHLLDAANYMDEHGMCRHRGEDKDGAVCFVGALFKTNHDYRDAFRRLQRHLGSNPFEWLRYECKSKDDAVALMRAAAHAEDQRG